MKECKMFRFKQFELAHERSTMKVGTDAVVLGSWVKIQTAKRILDVGTGCGIIALMMAQRNLHADITGIDIDSSSIAEAQSNAKRSPWKDRVNFIKVSLQRLEPKIAFDHIVTNPPFFMAGTSSPKRERHLARHTQELSFGELIKYSAQYMKANGELSVIIPSLSELEFIETAKRHNFYLHRLTHFIPRLGMTPERSLMTFGKKQLTSIENSNLIQYDENGEWSAPYKSLTQQFYLKL